jgi:hypothetical protein
MHWMPALCPARVGGCGSRASVRPALASVSELVVCRRTGVDGIVVLAVHLRSLRGVRIGYVVFLSLPGSPPRQSHKPGRWWMSCVAATAW